MPTGFSKRGWTAWLLSCVDRRVFATAPVVLDLLNWNPNLHHHYRAYGGWSWAFQPYWAEGVSKYIDHPRAKEAFDEHAGDPFAYNERLAALPKLIVSGTGDQFFLLDDSHYFFLELLGENNFMQIMENTDHGLGGHTDRLWQNYRSFFVASYEDFEFPRIEQERIVTEDGGEILVNLDRAPKSIRGWYADTTNVTVETDDEGNEVHRRDFRLRTALRNNPIVWEEVAVEQVDDTRFRLAMDLRDGGEGYRGFFIDMTFDGPREDAPFDELNFATEINIVPDTFPWEQCSSEEECRGSLK
jgi:PhoPQ-activated pathogenicity-related protein